MFIPKLFVAGAEFAFAGEASKALNQSAADGPPIWSFAGSYLDYDGLVLWLKSLWTALLEWISQPHVLAVIMAWAITFTVVCIIILGLGFGPVGIGAGTLAAAFQSYMYGAFTPAGGVFATLTSVAMTGLLSPVIFVGASILATVVASIVWVCGVGRPPTA